MTTAYEKNGVRLTVYSRKAGSKNQFYFKLWTKGVNAYENLPMWPVGSTVYSRDGKWYWTFTSYGYESFEEAENAGLREMGEMDKRRKAV